MKRTEESKRKISTIAKERGYGKWIIGKEPSPETRLKLSIANKGKKMGDNNPARRPEVRKKISDSLKGRKLTDEHKAKLKFCQKTAFERILQEIPELEKKGFKCIPIGKVIPDIIGIKDGKIYAIEVERSKPNYDKYTDDIRKYFEDIIWILR
jgi:hypothetical protein